LFSITQLQKIYLLVLSVTSESATRHWDLALFPKALQFQLSGARPLSWRTLDRIILSLYSADKSAGAVFSHDPHLWPGFGQNSAISGIVRSEQDCFAVG